MRPLTGGVISNCNCEIDTTQCSVSSGYGGVVYVYGGVFAMTGGAITENSSTTTCSGVQFYNGSVSLSGTARIAGNSGPYRDLYVPSGKSASVCATGDFRGHVGLSQTSVSLGANAGVTMASGTTGAGCFYPSLQTESPGYVGVVDAASGSVVKWGAAAGRINDVWLASKSDADLACPKTLVLDAEGISALPYVFGGVAQQVDAAVTLAFDVDAMQTYLRTAGTPLVLFRTGDGAPFAGTLSFVLPEGCKNRRLAIRTSGGEYRLTRNTGMVVVFR